MKPNTAVTVRAVRQVKPVLRSLAKQAGVPRDRLPAMFPEWRKPNGPVGMLTTKDVWLLADLDTEWQAAYRIVSQDGRAVVGELRIYPREPQRFHRNQTGFWSGEWLGAQANAPAGGLTATIARRARLGADLLGGKYVVSSLQRRARQEHTKSPLSEILVALGIRSLQAPQVADKRSGQNLRSCARIAAAYAEACTTSSGRPQKETAERLGLRPEQVRDAVHRARGLGLLTKTERGRSGGTLTAAGRAALKTSGPRRRRL